MSDDIKGNLRVFGCGGGGINLVSYFSGELKDSLGFANLLPAYIDTSRSNLKQGIKPEQVFVLEGADGSGKVRKENHEEIAKMVPRILKDHVPTDFNVVVFTASGGTGSVAGPLIVRELLTRGKGVICIVVGSEESAITGLNTFNTLKSLDHIARDIGAPVPVYYCHNARDVRRTEIDKDAYFAISSLAVLTSRQNREMDTMDIKKFLNFHEVTGVAPQLSWLKIYSAADQVDEQSPQAFSIACLMKSEDELQPQLVADYSSAGYYREGVDVTTSLFFTQETEALKPLLAHLSKIGENARESRAARVEGPSFVGKDDTISSTGLVL